MILRAECQESGVEYSGLTTVSIEYKCDGEFSEDKVRSATVVQAGGVYSRTEIRKSIENIYSLGGFSNVAVNARLAENGVLLTFTLTRQVKTRNINLAGNKKLKRDEIIGIMRLKPGEDYDDSIAEMDVEAIKSLYRSRGYFNADISFLPVVDSKSKQADVSLEISENGQSIVTEVIFIGTNEAVVRTAELLNAMKEVKLEGVYEGQQALDSDARCIEERYRQQGYLTAKVKKAIALSDQDAIEEYRGKGKSFTTRHQSPSPVTIVIDIGQGRRVFVKVVGNNEIKDDAIKKSIAMQRMHSVSESALLKSDEDIKNLYKSRGYYLVEVDHQILKDKVWYSDTDWWEPVSGFASFEILGKVMRMSSFDSAPQLQSPEVQIDPDVYQKIQIRMRTSKGSVGRLYWITDRSKKWDKNVEFKLTSDNQFRDYEIDMRPNLKSQIKNPKSLKWSGNVTRLRLSPVDLPGADADIVWIKAITESIPVVFRVKENQRMKITRDVAIVSSSDQRLEMAEEDIRKQMLTRKKNLLSFWPFKRYVSSGIFDDATFQMDLRAIIAFYKDKGYPNARIDDSGIIPNPKKGELDITITISEGPKTIVTQVILKGSQKGILDIKEVLLKLPSVVSSFNEQNLIVESLDPPRARYNMIPPRVFREDDIVADRSYLRSRYADEGYLAQIEPIKQFNSDHTEIVITYQVVEGKQIKIDDEIEISGNTRTKRWVIERELSDRLTKDRVFSSAEIAKSWQRIYDLGLFESVKPDTKPIGGYDDLYKLTIDVTERKAGSVSIHAGFSSQEDFRGGIEAVHANLWGTGRRTSFKSQIGMEGTRFAINYSEPRILNTRALGLVDIYRQSDKDYAETRTGSRAGISYRFFRINTLTGRYRYDVVEYEDVNKEERVAKIGRIETTFQRDGRDNSLNPKKGLFTGLTLEYADRRLGGAENFAKFTLNNMYYSQFSRSIVLALGQRAGYTWGLGGERRVLAPEQFKLSDYTTPRGYQWEISDTGSVMFNVSMEIRFHIYKWIGAAAFFDSGYVYDRLYHFDIQAMKSSIGLGLRLITPIGPARLDYGYPIRGDGDRKYWPHVAFGHAF